MNTLLVGTLLALGALSFVLYPLLAGEVAQSPDDLLPIAVPESRNQAIDALREIEFDRATGKLSDADYDSLKASYTSAAISAMRDSGGPYCSNCGYRTEQNAKFCSRCGEKLHG